MKRKSDNYIKSNSAKVLQQGKEEEFDSTKNNSHFGGTNIFFVDCTVSSTHKFHLSHFLALVTNTRQAKCISYFFLKLTHDLNLFWMLRNNIHFLYRRSNRQRSVRISLHRKLCHRKIITQEQANVHRLAVQQNTIKYYQPVPFPSSQNLS